MSSKKKPAQQKAIAQALGATPKQAATKVDPAAEAKAKVDAEAKMAADEERKMAIQGTETAAQIAAREAMTIKNPRKARPRGQRSLISDSSLGAGSTYGSTNLG